MKALIWKDYRLNRSVFLLGVALLLGPYAVAIGEAVHSSWPAWPSGSEWASLLAITSSISLAVSCLTLVALAGNAIACERADRSAEFLAYLPPSRAEILSSKAMLGALAAAVIWLINLCVADVLVPALGPVQSPIASELPSHWPTAASAVMLFGTAWLGSALLESPAMATSAGVGAWMAVPFLLHLLGALSGHPTRDELLDWVVAVYFVIGALSFVGGTVYYLRRVEP